MKEARIMLERMAHRGACSCDNDSGDGAGVLTAIPDKLYRNELLQLVSIIFLLFIIMIFVFNYLLF